MKSQKEKNNGSSTKDIDMRSPDSIQAAPDRDKIQRAIRAIQEDWHNTFWDEYVHSDDYAFQMLHFAGELNMVIEAICICSQNPKVSSNSFESRATYVFGIMRNLKGRGLKVKYEDLDLEL